MTRNSKIRTVELNISSLFTVGNIGIFVVGSGVQIRLDFASLADLVDLSSDGAVWFRPEIGTVYTNDVVTTWYVRQNLLRSPSGASFGFTQFIRVTLGNSVGSVSTSTSNKRECAFVSANAGSEFWGRYSAAVGALPSGTPTTLVRLGTTRNVSKFILNIHSLRGTAGAGSTFEILIQIGSNVATQQRVAYYYATTDRPITDIVEFTFETPYVDTQSGKNYVDLIVIGTAGGVMSASMSMRVEQ